MKKLLNLKDFVDSIKEYYLESYNTERVLKLILAYNDFLDQELKLDMFVGDKPLLYGVSEDQARFIINSIRFKTITDLIELGVFDLEHDHTHDVYGWYDESEIVNTEKEIG
jgi:hypothetical protein